MPKVNTGAIERKQIDVNPKSPTFGQTRWVAAGIDLTLCPADLYRSAAITQTVYRDDCGAGATSTGVSYTLPKGAVTDSTSQTDVDARARVLFADNALNFARANATCKANASKPTIRVTGFEFITKTWYVYITRSITVGPVTVEVTINYADGRILTGTGVIGDGSLTGTVLINGRTSGVDPAPEIEGLSITGTTPNTYEILY